MALRKRISYSVFENPCKVDPQSDGCNPCKVDPQSDGCNPCKVDPQSDGCNPCKVDPQSDGCNPCKVDPQSDGCDPCKVDPRSDGCDPCKVYPQSDGCVEPIDPDTPSPDQPKVVPIDPDTPSPDQPKVVPIDPDTPSPDQPEEIYCKDSPEDDECIDIVDTRLGGEKIPNQYLVLLKNYFADKHEASLSSLQDLTAKVKNLGVEVLDVYEKIIPGFAIELLMKRFLATFLRFLKMIHG